MVSLDINIIDTNSPKTLSILDVSLYDTSVIVSPQVTITVPGFSPKVLAFTPNKINTFNSNNLGFTNVTDAAKLSELPDGVYKVLYEEDTYSVDKVFMRAEKLRCKLEKAMLCLNFCDNSKASLSMNMLTKIDFMINTSIAAANVCNVHLAVELYRQADLEVDRFLNKCR